jgi:serine/threonine protein kinase
MQNNDIYYIKGQRVVLDPTKSKGKGGEADIYDIGKFYNDGRDIVAKIFKSPDHADYRYANGAPILHEQKGAIERLKLHQTKLKNFPKNLPSQIVTPIDLVTDVFGHYVKGYTMEFIKGWNLLSMYRQKDFYQPIAKTNILCEFLKDLYAAVCETHQQKIIFGDFNELNILVSPTHNKVKIIDADSIQFKVKIDGDDKNRFDQYLCRTFMQNFVDPLLCEPNPDPKTSGAILAGMYNFDSDWYAFAIMVMQSFLFLDGGPYAGVYRPKDKSKRVNPCDRWRERITVFHPEVIYPKPARPLKVLPDDFLHLLHLIFVKDKRIPINKFDFTWTLCNCGVMYARNYCPVCQKAPPFVAKETVLIHGKVKATTIFKKPFAKIIYATSQNGEIKFLYHNENEYRRENDELVVKGQLDPQMRVRICGNTTIIGKKNQLFTIEKGNILTKNNVDCYGALPLMDANSHHHYWVENGTLNYGTQILGNPTTSMVGQVLANQTLFWTGEVFGLGFYRAGEISVVFLFQISPTGINDNIELDIKGKLIDANCVFSKHLAWLFVSIKNGSKIINYCHVIDINGHVKYSVRAEKGTEPWLDSLRGKFAVENYLYVPTDDGLCQYKLTGGTNVIEKSQEYPDTEDFLDSGSLLFPHKQGIYVVNNGDIKLIQIFKT